MGLAKITPTGNWDVATEATVVIGEVPYEHVKIVRVLWTDAQVSATKLKYPNGVVILNQQDLPENNNLIELEYVTTTGNEIQQMEIVAEQPFPHGKVALFLQES